MMVGELIDLLQPFRGRGDDVIIEDDIGKVGEIRGVHWDDVIKAVVIDAEEVY